MLKDSIKESGFNCRLIITYFYAYIPALRNVQAEGCGFYAIDGYQDARNSCFNF